MTHEKKRPQIRESLTDEEELSGKGYYGETDIQRIIETFSPDPDFDRNAFVRRLEGAAWWYVNLSNAEPDQAPSILERFWNKRISVIDDFLTAFELDDRQLGVLHAAADDIGRRDGAFPDFEAETVPIQALDPDIPGPDSTRIWPAEKQIEKILDEVKWLRTCANEALKRVLEDKTGQGPKPNKARIIFFQSVTKCYLLSTSIPGAPWKDRITGEVKGELYFYLKACLDPLGTNDTPSSILKAFEKTIGALPDFKHRCNL